jgi:hypothetical protein
VQGDVRDSGAVRRALAGIDVVFHLKLSVTLAPTRRALRCCCNNC